MTTDEIKLPEFIGNENQFYERKQYYRQKMNALYPSFDTITESEYTNLIEQIRKGDEESKDVLFEKSIGLLAKKISYIYTKYDIEDIIPFEDGVSSCLLECHLKLLNSKKFPDSLDDYYKRNISINCLRYLKRAYYIENNKMNKVEITPGEEICQAIDEQEWKDFTTNYFYKQDFLKAVNKYLSKLNETQRIIIEKYFGINGCSKTNAEDIAKEINYSRSWVNFVISRFLKNLRKNANKKLKIFEDLLVN